MTAMEAACYIEQGAAGWWNLLIVVLVALLVFAVKAGMVWGRMQYADEIARRP